MWLMGWCFVVCSAITLGRVAWVCPAQLAPHLGHFIAAWTSALRSIRDDVEKEHAFLGLCALLRINPEVPPSCTCPHLHSFFPCRGAPHVLASCDSFCLDLPVNLLILHTLILKLPGGVWNGLVAPPAEPLRLL